MENEKKLPKNLSITLNTLDSISIWVGKLFAWLIIPMVGSLVYEVIARYIFLSPTVWAMDLTCMLFGTLAMMGGAYTLKQKMHIRTDFFYNRWSVRLQGMVDVLLYLFFFFPGMAIFLWVSWDFASVSWMQKERLITSPWMAPVYPFKIVIPLSTALLLIQGISELLKSIYAMLYNKFPN